MANVTQTNANIYNANSNNNNNKSNNDTSMSSGVSSLRDVCNFLQQPSKGQKINLQADAASYDHVVEMIRGLDLQDDGIEMNRKIKQIEIDFCNIVHNEDVLCESMEYMNNKALADPETSLKFAMLFSSRSFDALAMNDTKVRCTMLKILETNFMNAEIYRTQDRNRLYNSITMLGEYYHRVRLADNSPVKILGESLLTLLQQELTETQSVDVRLAKLILSQITLNGRLLGARHQPQMAQLFYYIRCQLIEKHTLTATVKALLLMTLDMYYSNFQNLSKDLEDLYTKYFLQGEQEEAAVQQEILNGNHTTELESTTTDVTTTKKWSEQVCEESFGELEDNPWLVNNELSYSVKQPQQQTSPKEKYIKSPKQQPKELLEEVKPMPRWRAPRFNRESHHQDNKLKSREQFGRRLSGNYDDDEEQSVRSEGGNIRLYSINDRLKYSQEKLASSVGDNNSQHYYNAASIANSNWDRQSQRDDRSERSYMSNYERGHVHPRGRHNNNNNNKNNNNNNGNKQIYDKPPRFQKQQQQQQHQQQQQQQQQQHQKHHHTDSWRRRWPARGNSSPRDTFDVAEREDDVQSQSSNRARTLPRPFKGNFEKNEHPQEHIASASYRRRSSQSPGQYTKSRNYRSHNNNNNNNSNHARYSSQSSLASEASSVYLKRQQQQQQHHQHKNTRNFNNNHHRNNKNGLKSDKDWSNDADNAAAGIDGEIVKNARQTTNYMNYLSQK